MNKVFNNMNDNIFEDIKIQIIEELINNETYIRELAEKMNKPLSSIFQKIRKMEKLNIIKTQIKKNRKYLSVNYDSALTREAIKLIFIQKILNLKSFKSLIKEKGVQKIYLFGSASKGLADSSSDLDIAIIIDNKTDKTKIEKYRRKIETEISKETDLIVITKKEFDSMFDEKRQILINILEGTLIYGNIFK
jgi:predicted nucleotidyltransferase